MIKKRIAIIGLKGLPAFGGAATVGENLIDQLKSEFDITVYSTASHTNMESGKYKDINQIVFSAIRQKKFNTFIYYIKSGLHAFFIGKYDLIHLHHSDAAFILLLLRIRYKVIVTTHGVHNLGILPKWKRYKSFFQFQIKYFLPCANHIVCVSPTEQKWLKSSFNIVAQFIPNGITPNYDIDKKEYRYSMFFGAGRIIESKGCDKLLKALNEINYNGKIAIAGDLNQSKGYKALILELSKDLNISFLGLIKDKSKLLEEISSSKLFIYPSEYESMSMMLLEAASVKTPIICSDIIENRDIFNDNEVLFFSLNEDQSLNDNILWAINNYEKMGNKAVNAYNKISTHYTWDLISKEYLKLYNGLIK